MTTPVVLLPCLPAADAVRGSALARAFAARGWDVCVYCTPEEEAMARRLVDTVRASGGRAAVWSMDVAALLREGGANAWLARCSGSMGKWAGESTGESAGFGMARQIMAVDGAFDADADADADAVADADADADGAVHIDTAAHPGADRGAEPLFLRRSLPCCLVTAPLHVQRGQGGTAAFDAAEMDASTQANLSLPIALTHALAAAWRAAREQAMSLDGESSGPAGRTADALAARNGRKEWGHRGHRGYPDVVAIHLLDDLNDLARADAGALAFGLTQSALHTAIPALAHALAPWMRVVAVQTPLWTRAEADGALPAATDVAEAVCYLARAATITGSTLRVDGGISCAEPTDANANAAPDRRTKASLDAADIASERAGR